MRAGYYWSVDANSAWTWETAEAFVEALRPYKDLIYMVEQPFDVDFINKARILSVHYAHTERKTHTHTTN